MIKVKNEETNDEIIAFLDGIKEKQRELSHTEDVCYPKISMYLALKKKIFFKNLLLHPVVLITCPFYTRRRNIHESELLDVITEVLEFELTSSEEYLNKKELKKLIRIHKSMKQKEAEKENATVGTI